MSTLYALAEQRAVEGEAETVDDCVVRFTHGEVVEVVRLAVGGVLRTFKAVDVDVQLCTVSTNAQPVDGNFEHRVEGLELVRVQQRVVHRPAAAAASSSVQLTVRSGFSAAN